jgi:nucleotide-binding universal stress UspA family protein
MNYRNLVVTTDFSSTANHAVKQAIILASRFKAKLTILHARVEHEDDPTTITAKLKSINLGDEQLKERIRKNLPENYERYSVEIDYLVIKGYSAHSAILKYLNSNKTDLIIIGTHGRSGVERFLIGSVAEKVVRHAPCPVLTVSEKSGIKDNFPVIVVPFNFGKHSKLALHAAAELAVYMGKELHLIYVVDQEVHPALYSWGMKSVLDIIPDIVQKAEKEMDKAAAEIPEADKIHIVKKVDAGEPYKEIAHYVKEVNADLVVIATHGLVGLDRLLLGSTTERIIRSVKSPILSLKLKN